MRVRRPQRLAAALKAGAVGLALLLAPGLGQAQSSFTPIEAPSPEAPTTAPTPPVDKAGGFGLTKTQTLGTVGASGTSKGGKSISVLPVDANAPDYEAWERLATRAEAALAERSTSDQGLELLRGQLVEWRTTLTGAQKVNATRISTLRTQIDSLGPAPAEGATEAEEIAVRRKALGEQLARYQAPVVTAEEAYRRADGLITEIDRELRNRQADELMKLWPTPMNPANWPSAFTAVRGAVGAFGSEITANWGRAPRREELVANLPVMVGMLLLAVMLIWRGRAWIEALALRLQTSSKGRRLWAFVASLGQIIVPTVGMVLLMLAAERSSMLGATGKALVATLPGAGFMLFFAHWLGGRLFPKANCQDGPLALAPEQCAEGRFHATMIGLVLALEAMRGALLPNGGLPETAVPVLALPLVLTMALMLWRVGHLLSRHVARHLSEAEPLGFGDRIIGLLAKLAILVAVVGPVLALVGYVSAAAGLVFPTAASLALLGLLIVLMQLMGDLYGAITHSEGREESQQGLVPVLLGFVLVLASIPLFALIWGSRPDDLTELWMRFTQGFQLGETRISPSNFLYFAILFGLGFGLTRLFQGALSSTILPKTKLDQGGRNAIVSGVGYIGIFLAGLVAINAAGIDLSGLAIVAGALSLGIGFGLQNIVQNFVSGIILLIERPVSEGDWIEVGTVSGTVRSISVRSTRIQTFDRSDVIVPNADLVSQRVTNWTRYNLTGRLIVPVTVVHGSDTEAVDRILRDIAEAQPMAVLNPPPVVAMTGFTLDGVQFEVRVILRDVNFQLSVRSAINHAIVKRFHAAGIALAHTGSGAHPIPLPPEDETPAPPALPAEPAKPAQPPRQIEGDPVTPPALDVD